MTDEFHFTRRLIAEAQTQASSVDAWDQHYERLSNGRFSGVSEDLRLDFVQLFHEHADQTVLQTGAGRPGAIAGHHQEGCCGQLVLRT